MGRSNWYYDHPPACTCAKCVAERIQPEERNPLSRLISSKPDRGNWLKRLWRKVSGD